MTTKAKRTSRTTTRKLKVLGTETYINQRTGELTDMSVVEVEDRDFNFHKLWLSNILNAIDLIGNKKVKLAFWIIENLNKDNQLIATQRKIMERVNKDKEDKKDKVSIQTVNETLQTLVKAKFLIKESSGVYSVNPDVIYKGSRGNRMNILMKYRTTEHQNEQENLAKRTKKNAENMQEPEQNSGEDTDNEA